MRIDDSLKLAGQLIAAHMQQSKMPVDAIPAAIHSLHADIQRMQAGTYVGWVDQAPGSEIVDVLDAADDEARARIEAMTTRPIRPAPQHPLAQPDVSVEDKVAGTVFDDHIVCLECGKAVKLLRTHLKMAHEDMPFSEYLDRHGLLGLEGRFGLGDDGYPAVTLQHRERQRADQVRLAEERAAAAG